MPRPTTATIHGDALRHNLARVRRQAPRSRVMAMVKADGYGHGLEVAAAALSGADAFGVATLDEARRLRAMGMAQPVLLLPGFDSPGDLEVVRGLGLDAVVHHAAQLDILAQAPPGPRVRCWLKVDSGMHRLGFPPADVRQAHARLSALPAVAQDIALMTHFASSDDFDGAQTRAQADTFAACTGGLPGQRSLANSAAVFGWPDTHADWVRPGGALYGMTVAAGRTGADFGLRPAMTLSSGLLAVHQLCRGEAVGYSATWACPEDMPVGIVAAGYGDGYPRHAPSGTPVLVGGARACLAGRVSMDLLALDLRGTGGGRAGDAVELWGPGLPIETVAEAAGTIGYQLACAVSARVRRVLA